MDYDQSGQLIETGKFSIKENKRKSKKVKLGSSKLEEGIIRNFLRKSQLF
jgi:hypothetical protein